MDSHYIYHSLLCFYITYPKMAKLNLVEIFELNVCNHLNNPIFKSKAFILCKLLIFFKYLFSKFEIIFILFSHWFP